MLLLFIGVLKKFGRELCAILTKPYYIKAMRSVFSIINRMPEIGIEFYSNGPLLCTELLAKYLEAQTKAGVLEIEDSLLAAQQFVELSQSGIMRSVLFGVIDTPGPTEIARRVDSAVKIFMKAYEAPQPVYYQPPVYAPPPPPSYPPVYQQPPLRSRG